MLRRNEMGAFQMRPQTLRRILRITSIQVLQLGLVFMSM